MDGEKGEGNPSRKYSSTKQKDTSALKERGYGGEEQDERIRMDVRNRMASAKGTE